MAGPHSTGAPEGTRARLPAHDPERAGAFAAIVLLSTLLAVAIGDETASLTVINGTPRVIDVVVAQQTFSNVVPGGRVTYRSGRAATVKAAASYAAGQGVAGSAERSFALAPSHPATGGGYVYWGCTTGGAIVSPATGGPMEWSVTADTLATR